MENIKNLNNPEGQNLPINPEKTVSTPDVVVAETPEQKEAKVEQVNSALEKALRDIDKKDDGTSEFSSSIDYSSVNTTESVATIAPTRTKKEEFVSDYSSKIDYVGPQRSSLKDKFMKFTLGLAGLFGVSQAAKSEPVEASLKTETTNEQNKKSLGAEGVIEKEKFADKTARYESGLK